MTSRDLAEHFSVSRRTVFRDLRALSESGVPLTYSEGGGYEILEGYQLPPLMLTAREAATLLVGTQFMKLQSDSSLREDADAVALKIRTVLPREIREYVDRLGDNTVLDPYWLHAAQEEGRESGRWYKLSEAVARSRKVIMEYFVEARSEVTKRTVDPLGLVYYSDHWNLIAYDYLRDTIRNFRLDRIREMFVLTERFSRPEGFELQTHLSQQGVQTSSTLITLRFDRATYKRARTAIPARIESEDLEDESCIVSFRFDNIPFLSTWLMRYADGVDVIKPAALSKMHRDVALRIAERYSSR